MISDVKSILGEILPPMTSWRRVMWQRGTKEPLQTRFAAMHAGGTDGPAEQFRGHAAQYLLREEGWLVGERRSSGRRKYYLSNLPPDVGLLRLAALIATLVVRAGVPAVMKMIAFMRQQKRHTRTFGRTSQLNKRNLGVDDDWHCGSWLMCRHAGQRLWRTRCSTATSRAF